VFMYRLLGPLKRKYKNRYAIMVIIHTCMVIMKKHLIELQLYVPFGLK